MSGLLIKIGDATSQWLNAAFFKGHPNESISGRAYRERRPWELYINKLFLWLDPDGRHCERSYYNDRIWAEDYLKQERVK